MHYDEDDKPHLLGRVATCGWVGGGLIALGAAANHLLDLFLLIAR